MMGYAYVSKRVSASQWVAVRLGVAAQRARYHMSGQVGGRPEGARTSLV